jgi:hypothetical protein
MTGTMIIFQGEKYASSPLPQGHAIGNKIDNHAGKNAHIFYFCFSLEVNLTI